jgi:hypothetical protein
MGPAEDPNGKTGVLNGFLSWLFVSSTEFPRSTTHSVLLR